MKLAYILNGSVQEIIPVEDPNFPGVPVTERYASAFLAECLEVEDEADVATGDLFDNGAFTRPVPALPVEGANIAEPNAAAPVDAITQLQLGLAELAEIVLGGGS